MMNSTSGNDSVNLAASLMEDKIYSNIQKVIIHRSVKRSPNMNCLQPSALETWGAGRGGRWWCGGHVTWIESLKLIITLFKTLYKLLSVVMIFTTMTISLSLMKFQYIYYLWSIYYIVLSVYNYQHHVNIWRSLTQPTSSQITLLRYLKKTKHMD